VGLRSLFIVEFSKFHSDTWNSVGLIRTGDRPVAENYVTTYDIHKKQTSMPTAGIEPAIPVSE
jgi:hypothetical protein